MFTTVHVYDRTVVQLYECVQLYCVHESSNESLRLWRDTTRLDTRMSHGESSCVPPWAPTVHAVVQLYTHLIPMLVPNPNEDMQNTVSL